MPTLGEQDIEDEIDAELEARPDDFLACNVRVCNQPLTEEEKEMNARFVNEVMAKGGDVTKYPVCIECDVDNLTLNPQIGAINTGIKEDKPAFFPSNKKLYDENLHQNSEEFKQLGTLHQENRTAAYYPSEQPQPKAIDGGILKNAPYALVNVDDRQLDSKNRKGRKLVDSGRAIMQADQSRAI